MAANIHLLDLLHKEQLDKILNGFTEVSGVASIIADAAGHPVTRPHNFTKVCLKYCRSTEAGRRRCHLSDRYGGAESLRSGKPPIYHCMNAGLMDCAAPIIVEGRHLATVLCGQVLDKPITADHGCRKARRIGVTDFDGYLTALNQVPLMSKSRLLNIANLMAVITQTISELALQKHFQQKHSQRYLHKLVNSVSDCIISSNMQGIISLINEAGAAMFGYQAEELIGKSIMDLFSDEESKQIYRSQLRERPAAAHRRLELTALRPDCRSFPVQVAIAGIDRENVPDSDWVTVIRDISEEKKIEHMKEDLIGMVAHDIKNQVISMQKALELLVNQGLGPLNMTQTEITYLALDTSHQLFGMVCNLLDIYRRENGQFLLEKIPLDIHQLIVESVAHLKLLAQDRQVALNLKNPREPLIVEADWDRLMRTCINLIENAVRHSPPQDEVRVRVRQLPARATPLWNQSSERPSAGDLKPDAACVLLTISDQGPGISEKYQEAIFEKFFTIRTSGDKGRKSLGLGLTFCKQVIEAHGGIIWVRSPTFLDGAGMRRGCEFHFVIPVNSPAAGESTAPIQP